MGSIYLIRHGQASFGSSDYDKLSPHGRAQGLALGRSLRSRALKPALVVCGGMRRHRETAVACLHGMGLPADWDEDSGWNEYDADCMLEALDPRYRYRANLTADLLREGDTRRTFQRLFAQAAARWASGSHDEDYDEPFHAFSSRVLGSLARVCERMGKGEQALVFSSGGAICVVASQLLGLPPVRALELSYTLVNASVTKLLVGARGLTLSSLNEHSHLEDEQVSYR
jgi:broad specificity phosphatase PhoE